jgi:formylglycine-generating enzyme
MRTVTLMVLGAMWPFVIPGCSGAGGGDTDQDAAGTGAGNNPQCATPPDGREMSMVSVPEGSFMMGCAVGDACDGDESPQHEVTLSTFDIDETEVTQGQYWQCVEDGPCTAPSCDYTPCGGGEGTPDRPVVCVTHEQAVVFCAWSGKMLPTEAQWEKAARGGDGRMYPWGDGAPTCDLANGTGCGEAAQNVGSHPSGASPYGALDMSGNVVEWVSDIYDAGYYAASPPADPAGPAEGEQLVGRGGGYKSDSHFLRASDRDIYIPEDSFKSFGFRCAN